MEKHLVLYQLLEKMLCFILYFLWGFILFVSVYKEINV